MTHTDALLILNAVPGLGNAGIRKLIKCYGSPQNILSLSSHQLRHDKVLSDDVIQSLAAFPRDEFLKDEYKRMADAGVRAIVESDAEYQPMLSEIPDAPVVLYVKGRMSVDAPAIGVVGSRRGSLYGREVAEKFSVRFAELGFAVISGLARGIDTAAHQGCLKVRGRTVAVLGCGLSNIYPPENDRLMERIVQEGGAVISEFPMTMEPLAFNFPRRNRIISGLSLGVIVVEAARRSGALITADFALEQGREVFAVPGPIGSPSSQGVHDLIKHGAKLVTCVEDILEEIKIPLQEFVAKPVDEPSSLIYKEEAKFHAITDVEVSEQEIGILKILAQQVKHTDAVVEASGLAANQVNMVLLQLEMKGLVQQLPGKFFKKVNGN